MAALWTPEQSRTRLVCLALLGLAIGITANLTALAVLALIHAEPGHLALSNDFAALWSAGKIAAQYPVRELYDDVLLHDRQIELGMIFRGTYPFPYPPWFVFAIIPLGALNLTVAYVVIEVAGLALFAAAIRKYVSPKRLFVVAGCVLPTSAMSIMAGQLGLFYAAIMLTGLRLAATAPRAAGIMIGLLAVKPQLGVLIPVALVAAGLWRTIAWAASTIAVLALAATLAFGFPVWQAWLSMLPAYSAAFDGMESIRALSPTVLAMVRSAGGSLWLAKSLQLGVTVAVAGMVFHRCRGGWDSNKVAVVLIGTMLAAPHALFYDLPLTTAGILLFAANRLQDRGGLTGWEVGALASATFLPMQYVTLDRLVPVFPLFVAALFWIVVRPATPLARPAAHYPG